MLTSFFRLIRTNDRSALPEFFFLGTMASADFSQFVVTTHFFSNTSTSCVCETSPGTHTFFPSLPAIFTTVDSVQLLDFNLCGSLVLIWGLIYGFCSSGQSLPPSFFRFCLTADTLDLGYILPTAGRIRDFHPLERALTGRTAKEAVAQRNSLLFSRFHLN